MPDIFVIIFTFTLIIIVIRFIVYISPGATSERKEIEYRFGQFYSICLEKFPRGKINEKSVFQFGYVSPILNQIEKIGSLIILAKFTSSTFISSKTFYTIKIDAQIDGQSFSYQSAELSNISAITSKFEIEDLLLKLSQNKKYYNLYVSKLIK